VAQVFISYSRKDKDFVRKLGDAFSAQQRDAWVDWKDIPLTSEWQQEILTNIETSDNFIFVISPESSASPNCRKEIDHAVDNHKRMIPIFYRPVLDDAIPEALGRFQRLDFSDSDNFDSKFASLSEALDTDLVWVQAHTRLLTRAKEWEREGKDSSFLLRGKDLSEAEQWAAQRSEKQPAPTTLQSQYVLASRQAATKQQRIIIGAVAVALLVAVVLAVYAFIQKNVAQEETAKAIRQARIATSRQLAVESQQSLGSDLGEALQKAIAGNRQWPTEEAQATLGRVLEGALEHLILHHTDSVTSAAFSPDGRRLVTSSADGTARVWEADSGRTVTTLRGHTKAINRVAYSPDGKQLVTASSDESARVWDSATGHTIAVLRGHTREVSVATFSPDGKKVVTASADGKARVWDGATGHSLVTLGDSDGMMTSAAFSPDGRRVVTANVRSAAWIWDAESGRLLLTLSHDVQVSEAAFSPDGKRVVTASWDGVARLWDANTGHLLVKLEGHTGVLTHAAFSRNGKLVVTASRDQTARVWDVETGLSLITLNGRGGWVFDAAFSPSGNLVVTASADRTGRVWDVGSCAKNASTPCDPIATLSGHGQLLLCSVFSPDGKRVVTTSADKTARVWDVDIGNPLVTFQAAPDQSVEGVALSSDGSRVLIVGGDGTARICDVKTGRDLSAFKCHPHEVAQAAFSKDAGRVVIRTNGWDGTTELWNTTTGQSLATLNANVINALFTQDGSRLMTIAADATTDVWDAVTGRKVATLKGIPRMAYTPNAKPGRIWGSDRGSAWFISDGKLKGGGHTDFSPVTMQLVTVDGLEARVWDVKNGRLLATLEGHRDVVNEVAFSPDGKKIVTVSDDETARVWDAMSGRARFTLTGNWGRVLRGMFSPDGTRMVMSSVDQTARVWDMESGHLLVTLAGNWGGIRQLAFSADGKRIVTAGVNTARVYILDAEERLKWAELHLPVEAGK
jgi:WD40 repeat protein